MKFWLSGEVMADVADAYRETRKEVEAYLNSKLSDTSYGTEIERLVFVAVISSLGSEMFPEFSKYHRREKDAEFRLKIDHATFIAADAVRRRVMLCHALIRAIRKIGELPVKKFDSPLFLRDVEAAVAEKGWTTIQ